MPFYFTSLCNANRNAFAEGYQEAASSIDLNSGNGFAAALAFVQLKDSVLGAVLKKGNSIIACASLMPVAAKQIGTELRVYEFSQKIYTTGTNANMWARLGSEHERLFQLIKEDEVRWLPETVLSLESAKQINIVFAMVCRNVAHNMDPTMAACEATGSRFKDYRVIILENDSGDGTGAKALAWAARNPRVYAKSESVPLSSREVNIANARNRVLKRYLLPEYDDFPYLMMVDCDFPYGWPPESVTSVFLRNDWAGVCSNGEKLRSWDNVS